MRTIIDTHAHLYDLLDPVAVLKDCAAAGVSDVVTLGVDLASNQKHLELKDAKELKVHLALGLHPGNIKDEADTDICMAFVREHISSARAIGETGLDFWYKWVRKDDAKKRAQREVFDRHLALAKEFDLPIVIHSRGAWRESLTMARAAGVRRAEFHWYSGPIDVLKDILDAGFLISCTPALIGSPQLREAAAFAPLEQLMVETDTPVSYRAVVDPDCEAVPSTPKDVWTTLRLLSELKAKPEDEVLAAVNANARRFFGI